MNSQTSGILIAAVGFVFSVGTSAFISGVRWGTVKARLDMVESMVTNAATKDQLAGVKEDVAEIKGMFRMTLRNDPGP